MLKKQKENKDLLTENAEQKAREMKAVERILGKAKTQ